jgi:flagellar hook-length control protein FliK
VTAPAGTPAPQAVANTAATPASIRSVPLSRAAEAVENVIRLGSARGVTHARMSLRPADLGGVEIRLQQTAHGLIASVVADGAEAAQALQQAGHDLRRQLEAQGIELQRLDISYSGDDRSGGRAAQAQAGEGERRSAAGNSDSHATDGGDLNPNDEATAIATLELPDGVLVDVLA